MSAPRTFLLSLVFAAVAACSDDATTPDAGLPGASDAAARADATVAPDADTTPPQRPRPQRRRTLARMDDR